MKHYVLGFHFNQAADKVLLVHKLRPHWMEGMWNGLGGKIEENEDPADAIHREAVEETGIVAVWKHKVTFVCPGGTVFVFTSIGPPIIILEQREDERKEIFEVSNLPDLVMHNLLWLIPLSMGNINFPILVNQTTLSV